MSYTHNSADNTVAVKDANSTLLDKGINALTAPFAGDDVLHTSGEVMATALVWGAGGLVAGGMTARRRQDRDPIMGFLF